MQETPHGELTVPENPHSQEEPAASAHAPAGVLKSADSNSQDGGLAATAHAPAGVGKTADLESQDVTGRQAGWNIDITRTTDPPESIAHAPTGTPPPMGWYMPNS